MSNLSKLIETCRENGILCQENVPLAEHCTFRIGGLADVFLQPKTEEEIAQVLCAVEKTQTPLLILGKGSNLLFPDHGFRGAVLHLGASYGQMHLVDDVTIRCNCGASLIQLCNFACENDLAGLEFAYGIPGSVGGAIYMNAGAYGGEIADALVSARHLDMQGRPGQLEGDALQLSYRQSAYSGGDRVISSGLFRLKKDDRSSIRERMEEYMQRRRDKQPLDFPSAGSTFKRPKGAYASALIDQCGLKGRRVGDAVVSEKHAGFVINAGRATAAQVQELIAIVQQEVQAQTGYQLACEVKIVP